MSRDRLTPYYYLTAGVILQGLSPVLTKLLLVDLTPSAIVGARYLIAVLVLLPFGARHRTHPEYGPVRPRDWVALFLVGALGSGVASLLFTHAIDLTSAGVATSLSKTAPIFVAFFAYFTLRERITSARLLLVALMVAADVLIGAGEISAGALVSQRLVGDAFAVGAGVLRAMAEILSKASLRRFSPSTVSLWRFGIGFLVTGLIALVSGQWQGLVILDIRGWTILLMLGVLCTSASMTLYYRGLRDIPAHVGVSLRLLSAIVTVLVSWIVLHEELNAFHIAGIAVLVAGAYIIVVRTTRQPVLSSALEAVRPPEVWNPTRTLRGRVALLVSTMIAVTVLGATALSITHTRSVLNDQVRLTMVKTATMILQLRGVAQPPNAETYRQYLDRIIHNEVVGRFYTVQIMYLIVLDGQGNIVAFAKSDSLPVTDETGRLLPAYSLQTAQRLLALAKSGELGRRDIVPLSAELQQGGKITGVVKMGSKRSIAQRAGTELALRNLSLAILLVIIGVFISYQFTEQLARPLERLSSIVRRISNGELDIPLVPVGSTEVESLGVSISRMAEELRQGQMLRGALANCVCPVDQQGRLSAVTLLARLGGEKRSDLMSQFEALVDAVARNEGILAGFAPGHVLAVFGGAEPEQDDVLRAVVAGLEWRETWRDSHPHGSAPTVYVGLAEVMQTAPERLKQMATVLAEMPAVADDLVIYLSASAREAAGKHLQSVPSVYADVYRVDEPETGVAPQDLTGDPEM